MYTNNYKQPLHVENITSKDPIKHQWLDFLVKCADQTELPHDVDEIIKKGIKLWK